MWSGAALLSFNWRAIGGYQSSIISVDGIFVLQGPMSTLSSGLCLAQQERSACRHDVLFGFYTFSHYHLKEIRTLLINPIRCTCYLSLMR